MLTSCARARRLKKARREQEVPEIDEPEQVASQRDVQVKVGISSWSVTAVTFKIAFVFLADGAISFLGSC